MLNITNIKGERDTAARAARNMLGEMGARRWSNQDQAKFDRLLDVAESAQQRLDATLVNAGQPEAVSAHYREGIDIFMRKAPSQMTDVEARKVRNAMSTTTGAEGGYTVATQIASELINLLKGYSFMRQVARQHTTANGADMSFPTSDGTAEVGELLLQNAIASQQDMTFGTAPIPTYHFSSKSIAVPLQLLSDSQIDIVAYVMQRVRDRIGRSQNAYFTTGTGSGQPKGLVPAASVGKTGTTGQTLTVILDDLIDLIDSVDVAHQGIPDASAEGTDVQPGWMFSQSIRQQVRKIKDSAGRPVWTPGTAGEKSHLLDFPVYMNNDMAVPAANAKTIAFGNLHSYMIRDALEVTLFRFDDSAYALKGQVGFLGVARAGGNLMDSGSVKVFQHSAT